MDGGLSILNAIPWYAWIAIVAIVGCNVTKMVEMSHRHRERMSMIQMGMHPDGPTSDPSVASYEKPAVPPEV